MWLERALWWLVSACYSPEEHGSNNEDQQLRQKKKRDLCGPQLSELEVWNSALGSESVCCSDEIGQIKHTWQWRLRLSCRCSKPAELLHTCLSTTPFVILRRENCFSLFGAFRMRCVDKRRARRLRRERERWHGLPYKGDRGRGRR